MFRTMRRPQQLLNPEDIWDIMDRCSHGVLACHGDDGYPYTVPLNFVYQNSTIYFHCGREGHKIDAIETNPKVCFSVVDQDKIVAEEYTSYFRSVTAFGQARITMGDEWTEAFTALVNKYSGDLPPEQNRKAIADCQRSLIIAIDIDHITGKQAKELV